MVDRFFVAFFNVIVISFSISDRIYEISKEILQILLLKICLVIYFFILKKQIVSDTIEDSINFLHGPNFTSNY